MSKPKARFITFEGLDGAGKTTQIEKTERWLRGNKNLDVVITREPGGTEIGEQIRDIVLGTADLAPMTELLLMFAARAEHIKKVIRPALDAGTWVLCDRFTDSSYAYQGGGRGLNKRFSIGALETVVQGSVTSSNYIRPDYTVYLDIDPELGLRRALSRDLSKEKTTVDEAIERDGVMNFRRKVFFMRRVRDAYLARAYSAPGLYTIIPVEGRDSSEVLLDIVCAIMDRFQPDLDYEV